MANKKCACNCGEFLTARRTGGRVTGVYILGHEPDASAEQLAAQQRGVRAVPRPAFYRELFRLIKIEMAKPSAHA